MGKRTTHDIRKMQIRTYIGWHKAILPPRSTYRPTIMTDDGENNGDARTSCVYVRDTPAKRPNKLMDHTHITGHGDGR